MRFIPVILLLLVAVPFVLALLFVMPAEFCVSSWHLLRAKSSVEGVVTTSQVEKLKRNSRSVVTYAYVVDGKPLSGKRVWAGWISEKGLNMDDGALAGELKPGDKVTIHYDPAAPDFSLLEYGWPKLSLSLSMVVWGLWLGWYAFPGSAKRPRTYWGYALTRGLTIMGTLMIFLLPQSIHPEVTGELIGVFIVLSILAFIYARLRYPRHAPA